MSVHGGLKQVPIPLSPAPPFCSLILTAAQFSEPPEMGPVGLLLKSWCERYMSLLLRSLYIYENNDGQCHGPDPSQALVATVPLLPRSPWEAGNSCPSV